MRSCARNVRLVIYFTAVSAVACSGMSSEPSRDTPGMLWSQSDAAVWARESRVRRVEGVCPSPSTTKLSNS